MLDNNLISIKNVEKTGNTYEPAATYLYENLPCYLVKEDYQTVGLLDHENQHKTFFCQIDRYIGDIKRGMEVVDKDGNSYHINGLAKFEEDCYMEFTLVAISEWQDSK